MLGCVGLWCQVVGLIYNKVVRLRLIDSAAYRMIARPDMGTRYTRHMQRQSYLRLQFFRVSEIDCLNRESGD